ncbi:MAG: 4-(cytidine 5'-diphospho)-2-C-methyl-D-erythritol kinase, partial [Hyphomonadaceae bacterium]|nr:4-(cytidine 5'-diphospho)-2-C-methyl-D-erythritol kinase [Hyphomonadaceae bacterium]
MLRVFAPAKINLTLQVGPPGGDGMHPLQSVVAFADVGDWVEVAPSEGLTLAMDGPFAPMLTQDEDNLVLRAARLLAAEGQVRAGAALRLSKHLPVASGIGGGSSDAAAALKALNQLWALDLDVAALAQLGRRLGADVPVCLGARSAWMTGAGEQVAALALPEMDVVLVNPLRPAPTAQVF